MIVMLELIAFFPDKLFRPRLPTMGIAIEDLLRLGENEFSDLFGWNSIVYTFQKGDRPDTQKCMKFHDIF